MNNENNLPSSSPDYPQEVFPSVNGSNSEGSSNSPESLPEENDPIIYFNERERLKSFQNYVCRDKNLAFDDELKKKYARAGFYWTQQNEKVKCAFCHFYLVDLREGDNAPVYLHYRFQSSCPLYNYYESRNIPIDECLLQNELFIKPYYPQYETNEERLETFSDCIQLGNISRMFAEQLANMGYFFCEEQMIECHYCRARCNLIEDLYKIINQHGEQKKWCPFQKDSWDKMSRRSTENTNQDTNQIINQNTNQNTNQNANQNTNQITNQITNQNTNQDTNQDTNQNPNQIINQNTNQNTNQDTNQNTNQITNQNVNQNTNQNTNQDTNQNTNQNINQDTNQITNQNTNKDTNQNTNKIMVSDKPTNTGNRFTNFIKKYTTWFILKIKKYYYIAYNFCLYVKDYKYIINARNMRHLN